VVDFTLEPHVLYSVRVFHVLMPYCFFIACVFSCCSEMIDPVTKETELRKVAKLPEFKAVAAEE
jgi:hypothetical protein